jgi:hypothetical protein
MFEDHMRIHRFSASNIVAPLNALARYISLAMILCGLRRQMHPTADIRCLVLPETLCFKLNMGRMSKL